MAKRHNAYARILGTAENDPKPLLKRVTEQRNGGAIPMTGVPDLNNIAADCEQMSQQLQRHGNHLRAMADMQPDFQAQFDGGDTGLPVVDY